MQVIFHTGAHSTEDERLLKCLLRNKDDLSRRAVSVPAPGRYRTLLKEAFKALEVAEPAPDARDVLVDAILDEEVCDRLILSNAHFFGSQRFAIGGGRLYPDAATRMSHLRALFRYEQLEMFMAIRNPATFLPAVLGKVNPRRMRERMGDSDPRDFLWSDMVLAIREAVPDVALTLWCYEDSPLIWGQVLREIAGLEPAARMKGEYDLFDSILSPEGAARFHDYMGRHPDMTEVHKRRIMAAFLDKYALDEHIEEVLDLPGWTDALVEELTEIYDEDVFRIQRIPGVQLIAP